MQEPKVGDSVIVRSPSQDPMGYESMAGVVSEILGDRYINIEKWDGTPLANGQVRIDPNSDSKSGWYLPDDWVEHQDG